MDPNVLRNFSELKVNDDNIICMDLMNCANHFIDFRLVDFGASIEKASKKVKNFIQASSSSGFKILCFIDKSISTKETYEKWTSRRTQELQKGKRKGMVNMAYILGSIFQSHGITVHFSTVDCDDTIAAFAYHLGGSVLSRDCDFFRYYSSSSSRSPPYDVYSDYEIVHGKISFSKHRGLSKSKPGASHREILPSLPETKKTSFFLDDIPSFIEYPGCKEGIKMTRRACGSNLTYETNPHLQVGYV